MTNFAISWSRLEKFEQCPRKSYWYDFAPKGLRVPFDDSNPALVKGNKYHNWMENALRYGEHLLPPELKQFTPMVEALRQAKGDLFIEHKLTLTEKYQPCDWFSKKAYWRTIYDCILVSPKTFSLDWKGLDVNTPIPTPSGWTTMRMLRVGDKVFGGDGRPCRVTGKSKVHTDKKCFKIVFDDKSEVIADNEHRWPTREGVVTTEYIYKNCDVKRFYIPTAEPLKLPKKDLKIHPYVLGLWLGDGKHSSGEISKPDQDVWDLVREFGYEIGNDYNRDNEGCCQTRTVYGLRTQLRDEGLLRDKHIPQKYLRASREQRLLLLQGLMDSDGNANEVRKQAVFTTCDKDLSDSVVELLLSLGQRPNQCTTTQRGFGLEVTAYPVHFRPVSGLNPFILPRKSDRIKSEWGDGNSNQRRIISIDPIETVMTQCIEVDSKDNTYLCTRRMLVTHNTGKVKDKATDQLKFSSASAMIRWPIIEEIETSYVWLEHPVPPTKTTYTRKDLPTIMDDFEERVELVKIAVENNDFEPVPSDFNCKWCKCTKAQCEYSRNEN